MRYKKMKLFWRINDISRNVFCIPFDDSEEYYSFLKKCHKNGYRQIIITSEIMVQLLKYFTLEENLSVYQLELAEDDEFLQEEVSDLINKVLENGTYFIRLVERLNFLSEKSSIDIQRVYFKGRDSKNIAINFYLQCNGIIGIDKEHYSLISSKISDQVAGYLW